MTNFQIRRHRCTRCRLEFDCPHGPNCGAGYDVLPIIVLPDGSTIDHCPEAQPPATVALTIPLEGNVVPFPVVDFVVADPVRVTHTTGTPATWSSPRTFGIFYEGVEVLYENLTEAAPDSLFQLAA